MGSLFYCIAVLSFMEIGDVSLYFFREDVLVQQCCLFLVILLYDITISIHHGITAL